MDLLTFFMRADAAGLKGIAKEFASEWTPIQLKRGGVLVAQDRPETREYILLDGRMISSILDPDGKAVCVGMYVGTCVVAPHIARTAEGRSLVALEATTDAVAAYIDSRRLTDLMMSSEPIRDWANGVLRAELGRKVDREWCLAALGGSDRLSWFRSRYPTYEDAFGHTLIASFLGVTPVTFSRLRARSK